MKIKINMNKLYPEAMFYIEWARNCKNRKTRIKLVKKAVNEFEKIGNSDLFKYRFLRSYR